MPLGLALGVNINAVVHFIETLVNIFAKTIFMLSHGSSNLAFNQIHLLDPAYYLQDVPVSVSFVELFIIAGGTLLLSLLVSFVPAMKAGKEKPLDTFRKV